MASTAGVVSVVALLTIAAVGNEFLLVPIVTKLLRFPPDFIDGTTDLWVHSVTVPQLPIFTIGVNNVESCHFHRTHSLPTTSETSDTLKAVMRAVAVFLHNVVAFRAGVFLSSRKLIVLNC